ncbi:MAG: transposase [Terriglobia bacterium]
MIRSGGLKRWPARRQRTVATVGADVQRSGRRPSIPPERLLKASLLMALYTVRSERMLCEQLDYNLLYRWFLDMNWDEPGCDHSSFTRNRERLLAHDVTGAFLRTVVERARALQRIDESRRSIR